MSKTEVTRINRERCRGTADILHSLYAILAITTAPAFAQEKVWAPSVDTSWHTAGNWDPVGVPGSGNDVRVDGPGGPAVNADNAQCGLLRIGVGGNAHIPVSSGRSLESSDATLGQGASGDGLLWLAEAASWSNSGLLSIGAGGGQGHLIVSDGSTATTSQTLVGLTPSAQGAIEVHGTSTTFNAGDLDIGLNGHGELQVSGSASVGSFSTRIGAVADSEGHARVSGFPSAWTVNEELSLGDHGKGEVEILSGGAIHANGLTYLGRRSDGEGTIEIQGTSGKTPSRLNVALSMFIGNEGTGQVRVEDGGAIHVGSILSLGEFSGSQGEVYVFGAGSELSTSTLDIGWAGQGVFRIREGGEVTVNSNARIGERPGSWGNLDLLHAGSDMTVQGDLTIGEQGQGLVGLRPGSELTIGGNARIGGDTTGAGLVMVQDARMEVSGTFEIGKVGEGAVELRPSGEVNVEDAVLGDQARLRLYINEFAFNPAGVLTVGSNLTLDGELKVWSWWGPDDPLEVEASYLVATYGGILANNGITLVEAEIADGLTAIIDTSVPGEVWLHIEELPDAIFSDRFEDT